MKIKSRINKFIKLIEKLKLDVKKIIKKKCCINKTFNLISK